ncbi:unnamed protein product [Penicillium nalgiovense]|nr:unnamed protein product [Penicillium nalgiovense]
MLQTRNFQIKEGFYHHLLTGFPNRPILHSNGPSIASRRASKLTFRASFSGNPQKMRLDLSNISSTLSHGSAALASATATSDAHVTSPNTPFDPNARSDITCTDSVEDPFTMLAPPPAITSGQIRSYSMQQTSAPAWNTAAMQHQQTPASNQTLTDTYSVQVWQQQMMRQAGAPAIQLLQSRGCLASALKFSLHHPASPQYDLSGSVSYPTTDCHNHGHPWGHEFPILTRADQLAQMPPTATVGSPKSQAMSAESELISGSGPTHDAPLPFITASVAQAEISPTIKGEGEGIAVNLEDLHMGSNQFSQFGL